MSTDNTDRTTELSALKQALLRRRLRGQASRAVSGIPRRPSGQAPLSPVQHGMWVTNQFLESNSLYNVPRMLHVKGALDVGALGRALDALLARHEILRTTYPDQTSPTQHIHPPGPASVRHVDLTKLPPSRRWDEAMRLAVSEIDTPFDLARGPVFRALLIALGDGPGTSAEQGGHVLVLTTHHIATDGWSSTLQLQELDELYSALAAGRDPEPKALPIQYADYAYWQSQRMTEDQRERQLAYWRSALASTPHVLELPTDRPRPTTESHRGDRLECSLTPRISAGVRALTADNKVTVYTVLLACFATVLRHYCGQERFAVGTLLSGRNVVETEPLLGLFANAVALPVDLSGEPVFTELLRRTHESLLGAFDHQDVTFEQVVSSVHADRTAARNPVYQVLFQCFAASERTEELPGLGARAVNPGDQTAKVDLTLDAVDGSDRIDLTLNYATDLFTSATAERLLRYVVNVAEHVVAHSDRPVGGTSVLGTADEHLLTHALAENASGYPEAGRYPLAETVVSLFRAQAAARPEAIALAFEAQEMSFTRLDQLTDRLSAGLRERGVAPGDVVGVALPRGIELVVAVLGVLKAGAAYLALDPGHPAARLAFVINDAGAQVVVTDTTMPELGEVPRICFEDLVARDDGSFRLSAESWSPRPTDLAYVMYTSGSTGWPKGVDISHRGLTNMLCGIRDLLGAGPQDRWLLLTSLSFDPSTIELFLPLIAGGRVVIAPESARAAGTEQCRVIRQHGVTHVQATPSGWRLLIAGGFDEPHVVAITVGEVMAAPLAREVCARTRRLVNAYGPTEITVYATYADVADDGDPVRNIGRPAANTRVYLLDEQLGLVPVGSPGEVCVGGAGVARGYHQRPGLTAQRFVPNPFGPPGSRLYRTGDRARFGPDGQIQLCGRMDNQVKIRGHRVEPSEVDSRLLTHPAVSEAVVTANAGPGGELQLVGYVVTAREATHVSAAGLEHELRQHLAETLPNYMIPSRFTVLERMPLTATGKVDRNRLPAVETLAVGGDSIAPPRTDAERALAGAWAQVLRRDAIGVNDNFFEIGGDSVLAIHIVAAARSAGLVISPRQVLTRQTLAELAMVAEPIDSSPVESSLIGRPRIEQALLDQLGLEPGDAEDAYPLSPMQAGMLFHALFEPGAQDYLVQLVYTFDGDVSPALLRRALEFVVARHPVLRTTFAWDGLPEPMQVVHREAQVEMRVLDWGGIPRADLQDRLNAHLAAERERGVDLEHAPLRRFDLIRLAGDRHWFIWHGHHILLDGWSIRSVLDELCVVYQSLRTTCAPPRLPEPVPFRRYIEWLRSRDPAQAAKYWREMLADVTGPTPLAILLPRSGDGRDAVDQEPAQLSVEVSTEITDEVRQFARIRRITVGSMVHAAWALVLSRYGGGGDVLFGTTTSGRSGTLAGVEQTVGMLINTLPFRVRVPADATVGEWLGNVHEQLIALRDFEYCALVDVHRYSKIPSGRRLFETILMFEGQARGIETNEAGPTMTSRQAWEQTGYPLVLNVSLQERLVLRLDHHPAQVSPGTARSLIEHFEVFLRALVTEPDARLADLPPLSPAEWRSVIKEFNDTAVPYPADRCLHELFEDQADRTPTAIAARSGADAVTYRELDEAANRLAHDLRELGIGPESLVAICIRRGIDMAVAVLATLKAGAAYVPLDVEYPDERLAFMLADSAAPVMLTQAGLLDRLPDGKGTVVCLDGTDDTERISRRASTRPPRSATPDNLSYVIYTSGSTGRPKGTLIRHRGIVNYVSWMAADFPLAEGDKILQLAGLSFDISVYEMFWPWSQGAAVILARPDGYRDPQYIVDVMVREDITAAHMVPSMLRAMLPLLEDRRLRLRWMFASAEAMTMDLVTGWHKHCPETALLNLYGATEVSVDSTAWRCDPSAAVISVGRPIANTRVYLLDESGVPVPTGVPGEAYLAGDSVGRGYHGQPALTARRFLPDPFGPPGSRLYRTGDLLTRLPDGTMQFLGRLDHQVKVRGFRVEMEEIEVALLSHPGLAHAAVIASHDPAGPARLIAYVVASGEAVPSISGLRSHLQARLPGYMVPAAFVSLEKLPLNPNGKVDRTALPRLGTVRPELEVPFAAPDTSVEKVLSAVWCKVLGIREVGVHDDFFDLGGDSILSIQVMVAARRSGITLVPRQMFANRTIAELAAAVDGAAAPLPVHAEQGTIAGEAPLTPIQRWFTRLDWPVDYYNQSVRLAWDQPAEAGPLRAALDGLVAHHDALRLRLTGTRGEGWQQHIAGAESADLLIVIDVTGVGSDQLDAVVERAADKLHGSLNVRSGPLLRAMLVRYGPGRADELIITVHHLAVDTVSWQILLTDLATGYEQAQRGEPVALPAKTTSFQHWARRLADYANGEEFASEAGYWKLPHLEPDPFPRDHDGLPNTQDSAAGIVRGLDAGHSEALLRLAHTAYRTQINDLLITALAQSLIESTGCHDTYIDLEGHGREPIFDDVDLTRTVGWFTSIQPLYIRLPDPQNLRQSVLTVKEHLRGTPNHGIGYGIARYLRRDQAGQGGPASAPVSFNYLGQLRSAPEADLFVQLGSVPGADRAGAGIRPYLIEINAAVADGVFQVSWTYSRSVHREETVRAMADSFIGWLTTLLDHCLEARAATRTPDRAFLDRLSAGVPATRLGLLRHNVPGASIALVADGEVVQAWGEGASGPSGAPVRPDTVFQAGSVSKHVTALAVLKLAADGVLDLDEDVNRYLRRWRLPLLDKEQPISLRMLMSHTSGLNVDDFGGLGGCHPDRPIPGLLDVLNGRPPAATAAIRPQARPGERFRYSGNNFVVIEEVVQETTGEPFVELIREIVFKPLNMHDSGYGQEFARSRDGRIAVGHDVEGAPVAAGWRVYPAATGGLWTTAGDLARVAAEVQRAEIGTGPVVLSHAAAGQLLTPVSSAAYGLGTVVRLADGVRWFGHTGATMGFRCYSGTGLESRAGIVLMSNSDAGTDLIIDLLAEMGQGFHAWAEQTIDDSGLVAGGRSGR